MAVDDAERSAEQIDAGGDDRRPHAVVLERERLDEIVEMALVVRDVDDATVAGGLAGVRRALGNALDLAQDRIERVLQRLVDGVALRRPQLVEIGVDALARLRPGLDARSAQVPRHVFVREHGLGDLVLERHGEAQDRSISRQMASVNSVVVAVPPRSRVRTAPGREHAARPADHAVRGGGFADVRAASSRADSSSAVGLARFWPAMSGALPCTASNTADLAPMFAPGTTPSPPTRPAQRSETMSP